MKKQILLKDLLKELQGHNVKIGCVCAFWYCGECDKNIYSSVDRISKKYITYYKECVRKFYKKIGNKSEDQNKLMKRIGKYQEQIENFIPLLDREVLEVYEGVSNDEPDTFICIVEGKDKGSYFSIHEYSEKKAGRWGKARK